VAHDQPSTFNYRLNSRYASNTDDNEKRSISVMKGELKALEAPDSLKGLDLGLGDHGKYSGCRGR
jgi:hypothetical protein